MSKLDNLLKAIRTGKARRDFRALLDKIANRGASAERVVYIVGYTVGTSSQAELKPDLRGLLAWHPLYQVNRTIVLTYWESKEAFESAGDIWKSPVTISSMHQGLAGAVKGLENGIIKRALKAIPMSMQNSVILVAGVLAAVATIREFEEYIFARPAFTVQFDSHTSEFIEGNPVNIKLTLENQTAAKNKKVRITATLIPDTLDNVEGKTASEIPLVVSETPIPELNPREKKELFLSYPPSAKSTEKPITSGKYHAQVSIVADAGLFQTDVKAPPRTTGITIWPEGAHGMITTMESGHEQNPTEVVTGAIRIGPPTKRDITCALRVLRIANLPRPIYQLPLHHDVRWIQEKTPGEEVAVFSWNLLPSPGMQELHFRLTFDASQNVDWNAVKRAVKFGCSLQTEDIAK